MEFWGVEVEPGKPLKVTPEENFLVHISQASLAESKKDQKIDAVVLFVKIGDQKLVLGTLSHQNFPQISFDLAFEKEFELSHNCKNGSIYVIGYKSPNIDGGDAEGFYSDSEASDEDPLPLTVAENGKAGPAVADAKPAKANAAKLESKPKATEAKQHVKPDSDEDDESGEDESDEDDESDSEEGEGMDLDEDSDDDEDENEDSEEENDKTPRKVDHGKKRVNEAASKTTILSKKAKAATPQMTDGKKGGQTGAPHPAKKVAKTPANAYQSPKSGSQFSCGSCKRSFNSEGGLQSRNKAKHGVK